MLQYLVDGYYKSQYGKTFYPGFRVIWRVSQTLTVSSIYSKYLKIQHGHTEWPTFIKVLLLNSDVFDTTVEHL